MTRIGLVGCGRWGRLILRDLLACGAQVHVVARSEGTRAAALAAGATSASDDLDALADMDGHVVATPTIVHAQVLERLVATGRPIFVEKPMTADPDSARRLTQAAGDRIFVMDKWRYHPVIEAMRQEIASGAVGDVLAIHLVRQGWSNPHRDVGPLWILAPHDLAIVLHLTGRVPPVLSAHAAAPGRFDLGGQARLGGEGLPLVTLDFGVASPEHRRRCQVIGSRACLELRDGYETRLFIRDGAPGDAEATERVFNTGDAMPLLAEVRRFVDHVAGRGGPPMSSAAEGLLIVERLAQIEAMAMAAE